MTWDDPARFDWFVRLGRIVLAAGMVLLAACGGKAKSSDDTLPPEPKTTTTTGVSYDVPATIDQAYVQKVMQALDHVYGDAIRELKQTGQLDAKFQTLMLSIYTQHFYGLTTQAWAKEAAANLASVAATPGDPVTTVDRVIRADRECVFFAVTRNLQPLHSTPVEKTPPRYIALVPKPAGAAGLTANPTPWAMSFDGFRTDGLEPTEPCAAS